MIIGDTINEETNIADTVELKTSHKILTGWRLSIGYLRYTKELNYRDQRAQIHLEAERKIRTPDLQIQCKSLCRSP